VAGAVVIDFMDARSQHHFFLKLVPDPRDLTVLEAVLLTLITLTLVLDPYSLLVGTYTLF
jgi:hypothetical protein